MSLFTKASCVFFVCFHSIRIIGYYNYKSFKSSFSACVCDLHHSRIIRGLSELNMGLILIELYTFRSVGLGD